MVDPESPLRGRVEQEAVAQHAHEHGAGVPARGREPAEQAGLAGLHVEMHGLRIEFACEFDDLLGGHQFLAEVEALALGEILEGPSLAGHPAFLFKLDPRSCRQAFDIARRTAPDYLPCAASAAATLPLWMVSYGSK